MNKILFFLELFSFSYILSNHQVRLDIKSLV
jgi:hypothetical protein